MKVKQEDLTSRSDSECAIQVSINPQTTTGGPQTPGNGEVPNVAAHTDGAATVLRWYFEGAC